MHQTSLLHIDGDPLWIDYIARECRHFDDIAYLGAETTIPAAMAAAANSEPDLVLFDPSLAPSDPHETVDCLARLARPPRVLLFASRLTPYLLYGCVHWPVDGLLLKTLRCCAQLREATLINSGRYFAAEVRLALNGLRRSPTAFYKLLSSHEISLLRLLASEASEAMITEKTGLTETTVRWHKYRIMSKLGLHRTVDLLRWAREHGFPHTNTMPVGQR